MTAPWEPVEVDATFTARPRDWLAARMTAGMPWLLVHADDGVIWGRRAEDGTLRLSSDVAAITAAYPSTKVTLASQTVQQARIFGPDGELLVWRSAEGFQARRTTEGPVLPPDAWEEPHLLWGRRVLQAEGFCVLEEGQQGQVHAVPFDLPDRGRAALTVRHIVARTPGDRAVVALSRLVELIPATRPRKEEVADGAATH